MALVYVSQRYDLLETGGEKEQGELRLTFSISELWVLGNVAGCRRQSRLA